MNNNEIFALIHTAATALRAEVMEDNEITATTRMMVCGGVYALEERLIKKFANAEGKPYFCEKRTAGLAAYVPCKIQCGDCANKEELTTFAESGIISA